MSEVFVVEAGEVRNATAEETENFLLSPQTFEYDELLGRDDRVVGYVYVG